MKDSLSLVADKWTRISDHKKKTMSNAIDCNIGYFDNEMYVTGMKNSDDTKVDNIRPQVGRFVYLDDPDVKELSSSRLLTGNITPLDHKKSNANVGNHRHHDNEIDMVDLVCLTGTKVSNIEPRTGRLIFSGGSGRFVSDPSSFEQFPSLDLSLRESRECFSIVLFENVQLCAESGRTSGSL